MIKPGNTTITVKVDDKTDSYELVVNGKSVTPESENTQKPDNKPGTEHTPNQENTSNQGMTEQPGNTQNSGNTQQDTELQNASNNVATGDSSNALIFGIISLLSVFVIDFILFIKKRNRQH